MWRTRNSTLLIRKVFINLNRTVVSAARVKELRELSGAPMMDCKRALSDPSVADDLELAIDWLRKKGIAKATNQSNDRIVSEGLIGKV